ncbi:MAG: hypothetical protein HXY38_09330 [Chloroflexi bacterium]|nr:hypothetical protein [Chloroflexota bacterium]
MKTKFISTLGTAILLFAIFSLVKVTPAYAQTCTDAAGSPIPCPTPEAPTDTGGDSNDDNDSTGGSSPTQPDLLFLGTNENYLDPANWNNGGRIPGAGQTALLDGQFAVIDPLDPTPIPLGNLVLRNKAEIIIDNANLLFDTVDISGCDVNATLLQSAVRARKAYQSKYIKEANTKIYDTTIQTQTLLLSSGCGVSLDTSLLNANRIVVQDSDSFIQFGLGGDQPASPTALGPGHFARMQGNSIDLDGQLELFVVYGFSPDPGDTFEIITNTGGNPINGAFANAPEGAVVTGLCNIQFRITYAGGDGNDVVITAETRTEPDPLCASDFSDSRPEKNVLLTAFSLDLEPAAPLQAQDLILRDNAQLNLHNGSLTTRRVDTSGSTLNLFNFHLKTDIFIPAGFGGYSLNPSFLEAERVEINSSETISSFGIGGVEPAGENALGEGHHAHLQAERIRLNGKLKIFFVYGFTPQPGQTFQIITVNRARIGEFENAPEGAVVGGYCDVELVISYTGGNGDDVVLTAQKSANPNPELECASTAPENQPEPTQEMESKTNTTPYLIGGGILVLIVLLAVVFRKRPA